MLPSSGASSAFDSLGLGSEGGQASGESGAATDARSEVGDCAFASSATAQRAALTSDPNSARDLAGSEGKRRYIKFEMRARTPRSPFGSPGAFDRSFTKSDAASFEDA